MPSVSGGVLLPPSSVAERLGDDGESLWLPACLHDFWVAVTRCLTERSILASVSEGFSPAQWGMQGKASLKGLASRLWS